MTESAQQVITTVDAAWRFLIAFGAVTFVCAIWKIASNGMKKARK